MMEKLLQWFLYRKTVGYSTTQWSITSKKMMNWKEVGVQCLDISTGVEQELSQTQERKHERQGHIGNDEECGSAQGWACGEAHSPRLNRDQSVTMCCVRVYS